MLRQEIGISVTEGGTHSLGSALMNALVQCLYFTVREECSVEGHMERSGNHHFILCRCSSLLQFSPVLKGAERRRHKTLPSYKLEGIYFYYIRQTLEEGNKCKEVTNRKGKLAVASGVSWVSLSY